MVNITSILLAVNNYFLIFSETTMLAARNQHWGLSWAAEFCFGRDGALGLRDPLQNLSAAMNISAVYFIDSPGSGSLIMLFRPMR